MEAGKLHSATPCWLQVAFAIQQLDGVLGITGLFAFVAGMEQLRSIMSTKSSVHATAYVCDTLGSPRRRWNMECSALTCLVPLSLPLASGWSVGDCLY